MNHTICCSSKAEMAISLMNYKDEEKQLSESLFRNLHVMMRFYEPSKELLNIFEPFMFIKSNSRAFPHVIHFIFTCLDATEFNKRFRWPIVDKISETQFRKTTLDYMNHLNLTHELGMETLKLFNIHIPGGLRFIKIIHKFTSLIMEEELKRSKYGAIPNLNEIPDPNEEFAKLEKFVDEGLEFTTKLEAQSYILTNRISEMTKMIETFFENCDDIQSKTKLCRFCLVMEWREELDRVLEHEVKPSLKRVNTFGKQAGELNRRLMELFVSQKDNLVQYNKEKFTAAQDYVKTLNPSLKDAVDGILENNSINVNFVDLMLVFEFLLPKIMTKIEVFKLRKFDVLQFEYAEIETLDEDSSKIEHKMRDIETSLKPFLKKDEENFDQFCTSNQALPFHVMQTPQMNRRSDPNRINHRLAMMNGKLGPVKLFKEPMPPITRAVNKTNTNCKIIPVGQSSSRQLTSMNASLCILSRKKSSNASFNACATSTPIPSMVQPVVFIGNNPPTHFGMLPLTPLPATTTKSLVDRFIHSSHPGHIKSPSRRFPLIDIDNVASKKDFMNLLKE